MLIDAKNAACTEEMFRLLVADAVRSVSVARILNRRTGSAESLDIQSSNTPGRHLEYQHEPVSMNARTWHHQTQHQHRLKTGALTWSKLE